MLSHCVFALCTLSPHTYLCAVSTSLQAVGRRLRTRTFHAAAQAPHMCRGTFPLLPRGSQLDPPRYGTSAYCICFISLPSTLLL